MYSVRRDRLRQPSGRSIKASSWNQSPPGKLMSQTVTLPHVLVMRTVRRVLSSFLRMWRSSSSSASSVILVSI